MINELREDTAVRMDKTLASLEATFAKIRTGRAHPSLLDTILVPYYGTDTPLKQVANITVEEARSLVITPWEKSLIPAVEKAILKSDLGLTPSASSDNVRLPMPALTEENRKDLTRVARHEAENARVALRNIRRDANSDLKELLKDKDISEDEEKLGLEMIQKLTDEKVADVDKVLAAKETDLMEN
ncbi:MAG: ribosome recycling factor [Pseudomonadales bacterium]|nr:ribosome recycling factor [Pseudomonadales bacterium]MDP7357750.1 ribosome recycling factor [Pseudomonadales bacterium]MDP7596195.1 ribosome recycling factor [Pseudomonadales bacterium]HJN50453.1 ribosome recycling factor [Pseudomonadales bacterium]